MMHGQKNIKLHVTVYVTSFFGNLILIADTTYRITVLTKLSFF